VRAACDSRLVMLGWCLACGAFVGRAWPAKTWLAKTWLAKTEARGAAMRQDNRQNTQDMRIEMGEVMAELEETQRRISAALARIDAGVDVLGTLSAQADPEKMASLEAALNDERARSAELETRLKDLTAQYEEAMAAQQSAAQANPHASPAVAEMDAELQQLKQAIQQLRTDNQALRDAQASAVTSPDLINQSMASELDALRAERAAEVAEASAILAALEPLLNNQKERV